MKERSQHVIEWPKDVEEIFERVITNSNSEFGSS
jgi:hypothetical protein